MSQELGRSMNAYRLKVLYNNGEERSVSHYDTSEQNAVGWASLIHTNSVNGRKRGGVKEVLSIQLTSEPDDNDRGK